MADLTSRQGLELRTLRLAFLGLLPERVRAIGAALEDAESSRDPERLEMLFHLAHRLCGSAGIYGLAEVQRAACALECAADALRRATPTSTQAGELRRLFAVLTQASLEAADAPPEGPTPAAPSEPGARSRSRRGRPR